MKVGKWKLLLPLALLAVAALIGTSGALAKSNQSGEVKVAIMTDCKGAFAFGYELDIGGAQAAFAQFANGKTKFTYTATLDLRLQKVLTVAGREVTLGLESYNTTNLRNEVEEDMVTGPNWRKSTFTQPPRVIRLAAGVTF